MESQKNMSSQVNLEKEEQAGDIIPPNFKI
jgi:hypothetical protein